VTRRIVILTVTRIVGPVVRVKRNEKHCKLDKPLGIDLLIAKLAVDTNSLTVIGAHERQLFNKLLW
jgi:hypothetical protein